MKGMPAEHDVYIRPDPKKVAQVWDDYGWQFAVDRWHWTPKSVLAKIACEGRALKRADAGERAPPCPFRTTTPEQEEAIVEAVERLGPKGASVETGFSYHVLRRIYRTRGASFPKVDRREVSLRAAATKRARREAARSAA